MKIKSSLFIAFALFIVGCSTSSSGLVLSDLSYDYSAVNLGSYVDKEFTIRNKTGSEVIISSMTLNGTDASDFLVVSGGTIPLNILKNETIKFTVRFEPKTAGVKSCDLIIGYDVSGKNKVLHFTGEGIPVAKMALSKNSIDYGKIRTNFTVSEKIMVENPGTDVLVLSALNFVGTDASLFNLGSGLVAPVDIPAGSQKEIEIEYTPTTIGNFNATLEIIHNADNLASPSQISLKGAGVDKLPTIDLDKTSPWSFGEITTNTKSLQPLKISNTSPDILVVSQLKLIKATDFAIAKVEDSNLVSISAPYNIAASDYITVWVEFSPLAIASYSDFLSISHDAVNKPSPLSLELEGKGKNLTTKTFSYTGAADKWTVPVGVTSIVVEAWGAQGGYGYHHKDGGKGAYIKGTITVTPGDIIDLVVGGKGEDAVSNLDGGGGGGGSFLSISGTPILIAGGGGGGSYDGFVTANGQDGNATQDGGTGGFPGNAPALGQGGYTDNGSGGGNGGGGGGWFAAGTSNTWCGGGSAAGGPGGVSISRRDGGFGGGGASYHGGGGGGGYTGGNGGQVKDLGGGGGGSYNTGTNQTNTAGSRSGNGQIIISY